jgi:hypothetical protein
MFHGVLGHSVLEFVSSKLNTLSGNVVPTWNKYMPKGSTPLKTPAKAAEGRSTILLHFLYHFVTMVHPIPCYARVRPPFANDGGSASILTFGSVVFSVITRG